MLLLILGEYSEERAIINGGIPPRPNPATKRYMEKSTGPCAKPANMVNRLNINETENDYFFSTQFIS